MLQTQVFTAEPGMIHLLVLSFLFLPSLTQCQIVTSPSNEVTLPGGNATFNCVVNGAGFWTVNRKDPSTIPGFEATISEDQNDSGSIITTMSLSAQGLLSNNASLVLCNGIDYAGRITGSSAVLIIAGPPLAPYPYLDTLNSTTLLLSWNKPFTWPQVADILNYTVTMFNRSGQLMEWIVEPLSSNGSNSLLVSSSESVAAKCMDLMFVVSATNSIGQGQNLSVSGGFPTDIKWYNGDIPAMNITSLHYDTKGFVSLVIQIQPLLMCSYQRANFTLKVTTADRSGVLLARSTVFRSFNDSTPFQMQLAFVPLTKQRTYCINLHVVSAIGLSELEVTETFELHQPGTTVPNNSTTSSGLSNNAGPCWMFVQLLCILIWVLLYKSVC